jgi:hypothetical protein
MEVRAGASAGEIVVTSNTPLTFATNANERMRITSDGELLVGGTTSLSTHGITLQRPNALPVLRLFRNDTSVTTNDVLGKISFYGNDTTSNTPTELAYIQGIASGAHDAGDNPTDLSFATTADGASSPTERMRLDSEGNLGIGVTPSAWGLDGVLEFGVGGSALVAYSANNTNMYSNAYFNGTNEIYVASNTATKYQQSSGAHQWFNAPSGTAGNAITFTRAMTLDASGRLGIGTTSPSSLIETDRATALSNSSITNGRGTIHLSAASNSTGSTGQILNAISFSGQGTGRRRAMIANLQSASSLTGGDLAFYTTAASTSTDDVTERMRIDSSGYLRLAGGGIQFNGDTAAANSLDDYEEGTWTPALAGYTGTTYGVDGQQGWYTKIGNVVVMHFYIEITSVGTFVTNSRITGAPFGAGPAIAAAVGNQPTVLTALNETRADQYIAQYNGGADIFLYNNAGTPRNGNIWKAGYIAGTLVTISY